MFVQVINGWPLGTMGMVPHKATPHLYSIISVRHNIIPSCMWLDLQLYPIYQNDESHTSYLWVESFNNSGYKNSGWGGDYEMIKTFVYQQYIMINYIFSNSSYSMHTYNTFQTDVAFKTNLFEYSTHDSLQTHNQGLVICLLTVYSLNIIFQLIWIYELQELLRNHFVLLYTKR